MASTTEIANMALVRIGAEATILSLDDSRVSARTLKAAWAINRRAVIRAGDWNFASRRAQLAASPDIASFPYASGFPLPAESVKFQEILNPVYRADYALEGDALLCDCTGGLWIRYSVDVTEPARWDSAFAAAFAARLAWKCGNKIAGSAYDQDAGAREYRTELSLATMATGRERPPVEQEESDWILARYTGYSR